MSKIEEVAIRLAKLKWEGMLYRERGSWDYFDDYLADTLGDHEIAAYAAIEALMEPTDGMQKEGADFLSVTPGGATNECAGSVFEAMLLAALEGK